MQINLTGFLTKDTPAFMTALWKLLIEAQEGTAGVPISMIEAKKQEMRQAKASDTRAIEERDRRARLDEIRAGERDARDSGRGRGGRGRGRGRGRGGGPNEPNRQRDGGWGGRGGVSTGTVIL
jgi:serine/arginine repetitive matrix protein 1